MEFLALWNTWGWFSADRPGIPLGQRCGWPTRCQTRRCGAPSCSENEEWLLAKGRLVAEWPARTLQRRWLQEDPWRAQLLRASWCGTLQQRGNGGAAGL